MLIIKEKINEYLLENNLSLTQFSKIIDHSQGALSSILNGRDNFPDHVVEKIANQLKISTEEIQSWILADKYSKEILELAIQVKNESKGSDKLILTTKIDEILQNKHMSRTQLSKLAKYDQSSVNKMLTGKGSVSKTVLTKLSTALGIPEIEIKSWILADKYSLQVLESALNLS